MEVPLACLQTGKLNYNYIKKMNSLLICVSRNPGCELICRAVSVTKEVKQAESGQSGKDVALEVNTVISPPVRERSTYGRLEQNKNPSSLLGDLRQALLETSSICVKQHTWLPGLEAVHGQALSPGSGVISVGWLAGSPCTSSTPKAPIITAFLYVPLLISRVSMNNTVLLF